MKKAVSFLVLILVSLFSFSCEDSFEPKTTFSEKYFLNCVVNGDSLLQIAAVSRSYDVDDFNPNSNYNDPFIKGVQVYVKCNGVIYQMKDTAITRTDTSRYKGPFNVYSSKSFIPTGSDSVEVIAIPSDGITLRAKTKVPAKIRISVSQSTIFEKETELTFRWSANDPDVYYLPRLKIFYTIRNEFPNKLYFIEVPLSVDEEGKKTYPQLTKVSDLYYEPDVLDRTLLQLSENSEKENYKIVSMELEVKIFDEILSNYISATNIYYDELSVRLDEPTFTNVDGGSGIVGSSIKVYREVFLSSTYIQLLGYTP